MPIEVKNLTHIYMEGTPFEARALDSVSLSIRDGEFIGVIGHTGSGKSTLIAHLNALDRPEPGTVFVNGMDLGAKDADLAKVRRTVGLVFQYPEYQLFAETVEKDVMFGLKNFAKDMKEEEMKAAVREALEIVDLNYAEIKDKSPFELSGGQKRRVAIAGVIVTKPEVLILDEPAAGLDPLGKKEVMQLLHAIHGKWCKTIVIVSHDMDEISENCTRAAVFADGKVVMEGKPHELFKKGATLVSLGLDVPVTAKICMLLKERGIEIDTDFSTEDFTAKVLALYRRSKEGIC